MRIKLFYILLFFSLFSCDFETETTTKDITQTAEVTDKTSKEWLFIKENFEKIELREELHLTPNFAIRTKSTNKLSSYKRDSIRNIVGRLTYEPILPITLPTNYIMYGYLVQDSITIVLYDKSIFLQERELMLATYKNDRMISKILVAKYTFNALEIHCSILHSDLSLERCLSFQTMEEGYSGMKRKITDKFVIKSKYSIDKNGEIILIEENRLQGNSENQCDCRLKYDKDGYTPLG